MAAAPAVDPNWTTDLVLVGIGASLAVLGWLAFVHRDVIGE
jgi:hypothetical protein